jgi:hypothetical protein
MLLQVRLRMHTSEEGGRLISYIMPGYRPDWKSTSKPEYNCAQVFMAQTKLTSGEDGWVFLQPLSAELWNKVAIDDVLFCQEGPKEVGRAIVIAIYQELPGEYAWGANVPPGPQPG